MKKLSLLAGAALVALTMLPLAPAHADELVGYSNGSVDLLAGPDGSFPVVAHVEPNAGLKIIGCQQGFTWCDVSMNGQRGWINGHFLDNVYNDKHVNVVEFGPQQNVPTVVFQQRTYWDTYYHDRPFYTEHRYWTLSPP